MDMQHVIDTIEKEKIVVILRGYRYDTLERIVGAIHDGGIRCCEVTYDSLGKITDEETADNIARLVLAFPDMTIGAGTVLTKKQVCLTKKAGGKFIISPDVNGAVIKKTK